MNCASHFQRFGPAKSLIYFLLIFSFQIAQSQNTDWTKQNDYFAVFTFSESIEGITIAIADTHPTENTVIESAFVKLSQSDSLGWIISKKVTNCHAVDTSGIFKFYKNLKLEKILLDGIDRSFFVYCTKGVVKRSIQDVVFSVDECKSSVVVFRFKKIDTIKFGHPIFCTKKLFPLKFISSSAIAQEIERSKLIEKLDYTDSVKAVVFGKVDSFYFSYEDDFNWNNTTNPICLFPGRDVYVKGADNEFHNKWHSSLDLFGIPCD